MKNKNRFYIWLIILVAIGFSCNPEWKNELYQKSVSFVHNGVVTVYVKYDSKGGEIPVKIPIEISGSQLNPLGTEVTLSIDKDTIENLNFERFRLRTDLYFLELPESNYVFKSNATTIPKDSIVGFFDLNLKLQGLDFMNKYILPIQLVSATEYGPSGVKHYKKSLMQIIPFNDYSGRYSVTGEVWDQNIPKENQITLTTPYRNTWVVDENTIFFYAGISEEEAINRGTYKIKAHFNVSDSTVQLTCDNPDLHFSQQQGTFTVNKKMDDILPYMQKVYTTLYLEYAYDDLTNPEFPFHYRFAGSLVMEKDRNIQIPEQDQQVVID